jgi:hypothetical protein
MRRAANDENSLVGRATNSPKTEIVKTRQIITDQAVIPEYDRANQALSPQKNELEIRVRPCGFLGRGACPRAYGAKRVRVRIREKEGSNIRRSGEHRAFWAPMNQNCTLWALRVAWFESVFFASFLCRFGQRNDVPPRTVANSDKENIQLTQTAKAESSNPPVTQIANPGT